METTVPDHEWIVAVCRDLAAFAHDNGLIEIERVAATAVLTAERELGLTPMYDRSPVEHIVEAVNSATVDQSVSIRNDVQGSADELSGQIIHLHLGKD